MTATDRLPAPQLRNVPVQARSRARLARVLEAADAILAEEGAAAFTINRVASAAGVPVGSVYHYFVDKEALVEALALRHWHELGAAVAEIAADDEREPLSDPAGAVLNALATGIRARPGFLALWYSPLRSARVRDATRPTRWDIAASLARIFAVHWPHVPGAVREDTARMVVIAGDGMLREAFRTDPAGDAWLLGESRAMLGAYVTARLGAPRR